MRRGRTDVLECGCGSQYGYVALFAPACALSPALAFVSNLLEIREDASLLVERVKRPSFERADRYLFIVLVMPVSTFKCSFGALSAVCPRVLQYWRLEAFVNVCDGVKYHYQRYNGDCLP